MPRRPRCCGSTSIGAATRAAALGIELRPDAFVFSSASDGSMFPTPDSVTQRYDRMVARLGIETTIHKLRHYSATELIVAGVNPRTVAGRLGHGGGGPRRCGPTRRGCPRPTSAPRPVSGRACLCGPVQSFVEPARPSLLSVPAGRPRPGREIRSGDSCPVRRRRPRMSWRTSTAWRLGPRAELSAAEGRGFEMVERPPGRRPHLFKKRLAGRAAPTLGAHRAGGHRRARGGAVLVGGAPWPRRPPVPGPDGHREPRRPGVVPRAPGRDRTRGGPRRPATGRTGSATSSWRSPSRGNAR